MTMSQCSKCGMQYDPAKLSSVQDHERRCGRRQKAQEYFDKYIIDRSRVQQ